MIKLDMPKKNKAQAMVVVAIYISIISLIGVYMMTFVSSLNNQVIREYNHFARGVCRRGRVDNQPVSDVYYCHGSERYRGLDLYSDYR
jgi:hypothetical protein